MKKLFLAMILLFPLITIAQTAQQTEKMNEIVINYFKENLNNYKSYVPINYYDF